MDEEQYVLLFLGWTGFKNSITGVCDDDDDSWHLINIMGFFWNWAALWSLPHPDLWPLQPPLLCCVDYSTGFGGRYGVQADRVDQSAVGFDYQGKTEKHESQKGLFRSPDMQNSH